jgi:hypothetical protein
MENEMIGFVAFIFSMKTDDGVISDLRLHSKYPTAMILSLFMVTIAKDI